MKIETKVFLEEKEIHLLDDFSVLISSICREIDCTNKCPLNYKNDVRKCGIYEMTNLLSHIKKNTYI